MNAKKILPEGGKGEAWAAYQHGKARLLDAGRIDHQSFRELDALVEAVAAAAVAEAREPLVKALEAVEWVPGAGLTWYCPWCKRQRYNQGTSHAPDCRRAAALAAKETP